MIWDFNKYSNLIACLDDSGNSIKYSDLQLNEENFADIIKRRCLVFSLCTNSIGSIAGYVAFINSGIVPVLLNAHLEKELLDNLLSIYCPSFLWVPDEIINYFPDFSIKCSFLGYHLIKTNYNVFYPLYDNLALLLTTSGSTGSPKFVRQSYENIRANTESIVQYLNLDLSERPITTLPMNYTYGLSIINTHLAVGATILVTDKSFTQKDFWNFFEEQKATSFGGVPYTYEMLNRLHFTRMDLPYLRTMTQC